MTVRSFFVRKRIVILSILLAAILFLLIACDFRLIVRKYEIDADKIESPIRIAFVSDLHSCYYVEDQRELVDAIMKEDPDVLLLGGDVFDSKLDSKNTEIFLSAVSDKFPIYFATGNHDVWGGDEAFEKKMEILDRYGVTILSGESKTIEINGSSLNVCGVDDLSVFDSDSKGKGKEESFFAQLDKVNGEAKDGNFTILLSHHPEYFEKYVIYDFDLILSGHAHGGQWRVPLLLNGVYAPNQDLFPKYAGGEYAENGTTMIVSRGLARETTLVPRIFNRPELVIIEIE